MASTILIVGLGQAARFIVDALSLAPDARILAGVDPRSRDAFPELQSRIPVFRSVQEIPSSLDFDIAVVATPTGTHVDVCLELLARRSAPERILCEKPLATRYQDVNSVLDRAMRKDVRLDVLYHYAFAPEVEWMAARWRSIGPAHGPVVRLCVHFDDPKPEVMKASETLVSSWADSGINALSVLARFVRLRRVSWASGGAPEVCHVKVDYDSDEHTGQAAITTNWSASKVFKSTEVALADGTTFTLDHANGRVSVLDRQGRKLVYSAPAKPPLPAIRYRRMLDAYLSDGEAVYDVASTRRLHRILAEGFERNTSRSGP